MVAIGSGGVEIEVEGTLLGEHLARRRKFEKI
jgi:ribosomal protein S3